MKKIFVIIGFWGLCVACVQAQDLRERNYYYEILEPNHAQKEKVEGFASERVKES